VKIEKPIRDYTLDLPTDYLSVTQIEEYLRCPRQYYFDYILKQPRKPNLALIEGGAMAKGLADFHLNKNLTGYSPVSSVSLLEEHIMKEWENLDPEPRDESISTVIQRGKDFLSTYISTSQAVPRRVRKRSLFHRRRMDWVEGVEEEFRIRIAGVPVIGFIDLVEEDMITDFKVCKPGSTRYYIPGKSLQLAMYAHATHIPGVRYYCFLKGENRTKIIPTTLDLKATRRWLKMVVSSVAKGISQQVFPPCNPIHNNLCSTKWCSYWDKCYGKIFQD